MAAPYFPPAGQRPAPAATGDPLAVNRAQAQRNQILQEIQDELDPAMPQSYTRDGKKYSLVVEQQPQRARMCGFGDKDRRPITPPPCLRLQVIDVLTGKEVPLNDIEYGTFVISVDLWDQNGREEVSIVRQNANGSAIGTSQQVPFRAMSGPNHAAMIAHTAEYQHQQYQAQPYPPQHPPPMQYQGYPPQQPANYGPPPNGQYMPPSQHYPMHQPPYPQEGYPPMHGSQMLPHGHGMPIQHGMPPPGARFEQNGYPMVPGQHRLSVGGAQPPQGMFTRNLIGSLSASAFRLTDVDDKLGIWFVLQDMSVRTEGMFRLRFTFVDVAAARDEAGANSTNISSHVTKRSAGTLATAFSDVFQVYSAKKFPGVCESTALSKCFANQGIKIPIRKDSQGGKNNGGDDDDDE